MNDWLGLIGLNWRPDRDRVWAVQYVPPKSKGMDGPNEPVAKLQAAASEFLRLAESRHVLAEHDPGWRARMWEEVRRGEDWRERFRRIRHMDLMVKGEEWDSNHSAKLITHWK